jgi:hypothetical protein
VSLTRRSAAEIAQLRALRRSLAEVAGDPATREPVETALIRTPDRGAATPSDEGRPSRLE